MGRVGTWLKQPETFTEPRWWWLTIMATLFLSCIETFADIIG